MKALVRGELLKLTTIRAPGLLVTATVALGAGSALLTVAGAGRHQASSAGTTGALFKLLGGFGAGALLMMVLGATIVGSEYRFGTITATLLRMPCRRRLAAAQAWVVVQVSTVTGLLGLAASLAVGTAGGVVQPGLLGRDIALRCLGLLLAYPAYALLGLGIGTLLPRYHALAAVLPALWVSVLEGFVIGSFTHHLPTWSLSRVSAAAADAPDVAPLLPVWAGALGLVGYALAGWLVGAQRLVRSDIV
jgi:hypothetical protein